MELHCDFSLFILMSVVLAIGVGVIALLFSSSASPVVRPRCFPEEKLHFPTATVANVYPPASKRILFGAAH